MHFPRDPSDRVLEIGEQQPPPHPSIEGVCFPSSINCKTMIEIQELTKAKRNPRLNT